MKLFRCGLGLRAQAPRRNEEKALHAATLARIDLFLKEPDKFKPARAATSSARPADR